MKRLLYILLLLPSVLFAQTPVQKTIDCDKQIQIVATAADGYHFVRWSDGNTDNPRTLTVTEHLNFTAEFAQDDCVPQLGTVAQTNIAWSLDCDGNLNINGEGDLVIDDNMTPLAVSNIDLTAGTALIVDGNNTYTVGNITQHIGMSTAASIIACEDKLTGSQLTVKFAVQTGIWYFLCFPYDIQLSQITAPGKYVVYEYDGAIRAQNGSGGWVKVQGSSINANQGYIFQTSKAGDLVFNISAPVFSCKTIAQTLPVHAASATYDANWALVGNPFSSYFDMSVLAEAGFTAPIYVLNTAKNDYDAYLPEDDEYHFKPFEAFFVQNPNSTVGSLNWYADGRETYSSLLQGKNNARRRAEKRFAAQISNGREFVDIQLTTAEVNSTASTNDHTRIVFNDMAETGYELGRDAVKMSGSAPVRIYTYDADVNYAVNERPATKEDIALAYEVKADGTYRLTAERMDASVEIYDKELDVTVDLSVGDYEFYSAKGVNDSRFVIRRSNKITVGVDALQNSDSACDIYTVTGVLLHSNVKMSAISLPAGVYIIKSVNSTHKIVVE